MSFTPPFKPVFVGTLEELRSYMWTSNDTNLIKRIEAKESWHPCFDEINEGNDRQHFISGKVEVRLHIRSYRGIIHQKQHYIEKWIWGISIWGNDDTGMILENIESRETALAIYDALDECPRRTSLMHLWEFEMF